MVPAPQLARAIVDSLAGLPAVAGPDHPFLLLSPDVLLADEQGLIAVLIQHSDEVRRPERLTARLILSNLALPARTRFVAVQRDEGIAGQDFDLVIDGEASAQQISARLRTVISDRAITPREVYSEVIRRAERIATDPLEALELDSETQHEITVNDLTNHSAGPAAHRTSSSRGQTLASQLRTVFAQSTVGDFSLDSGAVYPARSRLPVHAISVEENPAESRTFDPFKLVRAAAFAGWAVVGPPSEHSIWSNLADFDWEQPDE